MTTTAPTSAPSDARLSIAGAVTAARACCPPRCFTYHAAWRLFRHAGLKGNPTWHTGFYATALDQHSLPDHRPVRALICAASDETMLAVLSRLLHPRHVAVTLVDACRTPLLLAATYARQRSIDLTTVHAHAHGPTRPRRTLRPRGDRRAALTAAQPRRRRRAARTARRSLHPAGMLLYTTRIAGPTGTLEYDRLGRVIQGATAAALWPGAAATRRQLAEQARTRIARPNPFKTAADVQAAFVPHFNTVRMFTRTAPHSVALRLHPATYRGTSSISVGITATRTETTDTNR